jgi:hypothetical protein
MYFMLCSTDILLKKNPDLDGRIEIGGGAYAMSFKTGLKHILMKKSATITITKIT